MGQIEKGVGHHSRESLNEYGRTQEIRRGSIGLIWAAIALQEAPSEYVGRVQEMLAAQRSQLSKLGVEANMCNAESLEKGSEKVTEFAAGRLMSLTPDTIVSTDEASKMVEEVRRKQPDGTYTLPPLSQMPDRLRIYIEQKVTLEEATQLLDATPEETDPFFEIRPQGA